MFQTDAKGPSIKRFSFGEFEIDVSRRVLVREDLPVALNSKAFDLLLALVENHGEVMSKDELLERVWEGQFVEEGNLTVHISNLRKLLGEGKKENRYIVTIPGRGYRFVAPVVAHTDEDLIVESHTVRRVIVEELDDNEPAILPAQKVPLLAEGNALDARLRKYKWLTLAGALLVFVSVVVGAYSVLGRRSSKVEPFQQVTVRRLTTKGMVSNAALSSDGKLFAYSLLEGEDQSLWIGHVDGGEPVVIKPASRVVYTNLKFTTDGNNILYMLSEDLGGAGLYKIPVLGGVAEKIADRFQGFTVSPDGKQFAYLKSGDDGSRAVLMVSNSDTTGEHELASLPDESGASWHIPTWSPDGKKMALSVELPKEVSELRLLDLQSGEVAKLATRTWRSIRSLAWMHDQSGLLAVVVDDATDLRQIWYVSYPDGAARRVTSDLTGYDLLNLSSDDKSLLAVDDVNQSNIWVGPVNKLADAKQVTSGPIGRSDGWNGLVWTKNDKIAYTAVTSAGNAIWMMNANGSDQKQVVPNGGSDVYPSMSDDGRYLVFQSDRGGHNGVWRLDLESEGLLKLTGDDVSVEPYVSPDGKWVVYRSGSVLWRISSDGGQPVQLTEHAAGWPQISPDSRSVACEADVESKTRLGIFSLESGQLLRSFETPRLANLRLGVHWTPEGTAVAYRDWANGIWKQDLAGGPPKRVEGLPEEKLFGFGWSPDGKQFAFSRGGTSRDVVLISSSN